VRLAGKPHSPQSALWMVGWLLASWLLTGCASSVVQAVDTPVSSNTPSATSTATATPEPTATATPTATSKPSATATPTATNSPSPTLPPTATSTETATPSPTATETPVPPPTDTATPTVPPTSVIDFRISFWRLVPLAINSGCAKGNHSIFITVLDVAGNPLNDIIVGDTWNNVEVVSGQKGAGKAEINLWSNTMEVTVKGDVQGNSYTSEVSFPFSSFMTTIPNDQMIAGGYCANDLECDWKREFESYYCGGHYSWEVVFQKSY
jgi:hypothetical protein